jgi:hypothetical protein
MELYPSNRNRKKVPPSTPACPIDQTSGIDQRLPLCLHPLCLSEPGHRLMVSLDDRLEWLLLPPFRMLRGELAHTIEGIHRLPIQRLFRPKGPVLIKGGDAILRCNIAGAVFVRRIFDKLENGRLPGRCSTSVEDLSGRTRAPDQTAEKPAPPPI